MRRKAHGSVVRDDIAQAVLNSRLNLCVSRLCVAPAELCRRTYPSGGLLRFRLSYWRGGRAVTWCASLAPDEGDLASLLRLRQGRGLANPIHAIAQDPRGAITNDGRRVDAISVPVTGQWDVGRNPKWHGDNGRARSRGHRYIDAAAHLRCLLHPGELQHPRALPHDAEVVGAVSVPITHDGCVAGRSEVREASCVVGREPPIPDAVLEHPDVGLAIAVDEPDDRYLAGLSAPGAHRLPGRGSNDSVREEPATTVIASGRVDAIAVPVTEQRLPTCRWHPDRGRPRRAPDACVDREDAGRGYGYGWDRRRGNSFALRRL